MPGSRPTSAIPGTRPGSAVARSDPKVQAFNRGKDQAFADALAFCKDGIHSLGHEVLQDVRNEMQRTADSIRADLIEVLNIRQKTLDDKMETLLGRVAYISRSIEEDMQQTAGQHNAVDQAEANKKLALRREDQIAHMTNNISLIAEQLKHVEDKIDIDGLVHKLLGRLDMDLQRAIDLQMGGIACRFKELTNDVKAHTDDLAWTVEEVRKHLNRPAQVDWSVIQNEFKKDRAIQSNDFDTLTCEIAKIQQALHLDYPSLIKAEIQSASAHAVHEAHEPQEHANVKRRHAKRVREYWTQTESNVVSNEAQTDPAVAEKTKKKKGFGLGRKKQEEAKEGQKGMTDAEAMKAKAKKALLQPQYNVFDYYHDEGIFQAVAKTSLFDNFTVFVVFLNSVWIAIDLDHNSAAVLNDADVFFQVVEFSFCTYFSCEIFIRFMAFERKLNAFRDFWFAFDCLLVLNMVIETWIVPLVLLVLQAPKGGRLFDVSMLRLVRMVKLVRISRISRFLRSVPELVIILKAIGFASRSVFVFFLLWMVIIYVFAILLRQLTMDTDLGREYFASVPDGMNTLFLNGILADYANLVNDMENGSPVFAVVMIIFILLASITVMYMLVGVLVEVVGVIASTEKEGLLISHLASSLRDKLEAQGRSADGNLTKEEFQQFLIQPDVSALLAGVNVDIVVLMDSVELAYEDLVRRGSSMTFEKMVDIVLSGRGANAATVKDTNELQRVMKQTIQASISDVNKKVGKEFESLQASINILRDEALARDTADDGSEGENADEAVAAGAAGAFLNLLNR